MGHYTNDPSFNLTASARSASLTLETAAQRLTQLTGLLTTRTNVQGVDIVKARELVAQITENVASANKELDEATKAWGDFGPQPDDLDDLGPEEHYWAGDCDISDMTHGTIEK